MPNRWIGWAAAVASTLALVPGLTGAPAQAASTSTGWRSTSSVSLGTCGPTTRLASGLYAQVCIRRTSYQPTGKTAYDMVQADPTMQGVQGALATMGSVEYQPYAVFSVTGTARHWVQASTDLTWARYWTPRAALEKVVAAAKERDNRLQPAFGQFILQTGAALGLKPDYRGERTGRSYSSNGCGTTAVYSGQSMTCVLPAFRVTETLLTPDSGWAVIGMEHDGEKDGQWTTPTIA